MLNKYEINDKIDNYIESLAKSGIVASFYPNAIAKALDIPLTSVLDRLNKLANDDVLTLKFEIRCNEGLNTIDTVYDYSKYLGTEMYCEHCGEDVYIDILNIFPIYFIKGEYKEYLKKKNKMNLGNCKEFQLKKVPSII